MKTVSFTVFLFLFLLLEKVKQNNNKAITALFFVFLFRNYQCSEPTSEKNSNFCPQ